MHLGAVWLLGAVAPLFVAFPAVILLFGVGGPSIAVGVGAVVVVMAAFVAVVRWTGGVSTLGGTTGRQVLWALLVVAGGGLGWGFEWMVLDVLGRPVTQPVHVLGGLPFAVVAGLLLRGRRLQVPAAALTLVLVVTGVTVLVTEEPVDTLDRRLAAATANGDTVNRDTAYAVAVPGYRPTGRDYGGGLGGGEFVPVDGAAVPTDRYVSVTAYPTLMVGNDLCGQPTAQDSQLTWGRCEIEPGGLVYRDNGIVHGYQLPVDGRHVTVVGTPGVPRDLLRAGATSIHRATPAELNGLESAEDIYAVTVPGYVGQPSGMSRHMLYSPADGTANGAQSVGVRLDVTVVDPCPDARECTPDGEGLTYVRRADTHAYAISRGDVTVLVTGGMRVDRSLLRRAALDARPATDEELYRSLPPAPTKTRLQRVLDRLRR